jgi:D-ribose pyranase
LKKNGIINRKIIGQLSELGHTDKLVICDCGLPLPVSERVIDISLVKGFPRFIDVFSEIVKELVIERAILATEIKNYNTDLYENIKRIIRDVPVVYEDHESFKKQMKYAKTFIRTGEASPYSNIILVSGVDF